MKIFLKALKLTLAAVGFLVVVMILLQFCVSPGHAARYPKSQLGMMSLSAALESYLATTGAMPSGVNSNVVNVLSGNNVEKRIFLNFRPSDKHPNEMVDAWDTPYQIEFLQATNFTIRSAGKNKIFGDKDDIIFESVRDDFVKP